MRLLSLGVIQHVENISQKEAGRMHSFIFNETKNDLSPFGMSAAGVSTWMTSHRRCSDVTNQVVMGLVRQDIKNTQHIPFLGSTFTCEFCGKVFSHWTIWRLQF